MPDVFLPCLNKDDDDDDDDVDDDDDDDQAGVREGGGAYKFCSGSLQLCCVHGQENNFLQNPELFHVQLSDKILKANMY